MSLFQQGGGFGAKHKAGAGAEEFAFNPTFGGKGTVHTYQRFEHLI